eukprot:TRINITY_DN4319_c0_g1_i2.p2 TRINITY_DN4319_c0_g1~~TRINITY_DN4319_c0_g1_i2.p2  ORF type:complete len:151 (+),score=25.31 TRINITY_DN4319_c0_g1_i2:871-1323(+)
MPSSAFKDMASITDHGIKKYFKGYEPWQALFELVWNGLDARAKRIDINMETNGLDFVESIQVIDNGDGIDFPNILNSFDRFNESLKKDASQHGSHGRGRLAFHKLCHNATWFTRFENSDAHITITSSNIRDYSGENLSKDEQQELIREFA